MFGALGGVGEWSRATQPRLSITGVETCSSRGKRRPTPPSELSAACTEEDSSLLLLLKTLNTVTTIHNTLLLGNWVSGRVYTKEGRCVYFNPSTT